MLRSISLALFAIAATPLLAQSLVCPAASGTSGRPCERFHFHAQHYNPDTRTFVTVHGTNEFASMDACERERAAVAGRNAAIVDYVKGARGQKNFEPDRIGQCHCDGSVDPSSPSFLTEPQRSAQFAAAEDVRRRVREKLLDLDLAPDAPLVASLAPGNAFNGMLGAPRMVPLPEASTAAVERQANELRMPKAQASTATASIALPLAPVDGAPPSPLPGPSSATPSVVVATPVPSTGAAAAQQVADDTTVTVDETTVAVDDAHETADEDEQVIEIEHEPIASAQSAADAFVRFETERIQNVINAVPDAPDENGEKVVEACAARLQALSNLRLLILGSGSGSRIAQAAREVGSEEDRLALVRKLFGDTVAAHWIPKVTTDVIVPADGNGDAAPDRLLRDAQVDDEIRRRALYSLLSRAPLAEEQQLWLIPTVDRFVQ